MKSLLYSPSVILVSLGVLLRLTGFIGPHLQKPNELHSKARDTLFYGDTLLFDSCHQARPVCGDSGIIYYIPYNYYVYSLGQCCTWDSISYYYPITCCIDYMGLINEYPINPHWFFFLIDQPGVLTIKIWSDVYFQSSCIVWGPFDTPHGACMEGLIGNQNVIYANLLGYQNYFHQFTINNAQTGDFYLMNIGGYSPYAINNFVHIVQINAGEPGAATLRCDIATNCNIFELTANPGNCSPQTNTFTLTGEAYFANPPTTGYLAVWDSATGYSALYTPPFISPFQYSIPGLPCDNQIHRIYAAFWDSAGCENTLTFQAPVLCPDATLSGGGSICENTNDSVPLLISFTPNIQLPVTFSLTRNGDTLSPITTSGPFPFSWFTSIPGTYTLGYAYNGQCNGSISGQAYVSIKPSPVVNLGADIHTCEGRPIFLDAGPGFQKYYWNTDETTQIIQVSQSGIYSVEVQNTFGCWGSDSISVNFHPAPSTLLIKHD